MTPPLQLPPGVLQASLHERVQQLELDMANLYGTLNKIRDVLDVIDTRLRQLAEATAQEVPS